MRKISLFIILFLMSSLILGNCKQQAKKKPDDPKARTASPDAAPPAANDKKPKALGQPAGGAEDPAAKLNGTWCAENVNDSELVKSETEGKCAEGKTILVSIIYKKDTKTFDDGKINVQGKGESATTIVYNDTSFAITITPKEPSTVELKNITGTWDKDKKITCTFNKNTSPEGTPPPPSPPPTPPEIATLDLSGLTGKWCAKDKKSGTLTKAKEECDPKDVAVLEMKATHDSVSEATYKEKAAEGKETTIDVEVSALTSPDPDGQKAHTTITVRSRTDKKVIYDEGKWYSGASTIQGTFTSSDSLAPAPVEEAPSESSK